jgi:putative Mg2+ transporter-C (MgtC) family protein
MGDISILPEVLLKLAVAVILSGIIGWEREVHDRPAGLRTHVLVCVGSAVYMLLSMSFPKSTTDPSRIAAQVATGMGFLGAGTIIRHGNMVRGLTTAASLWAVAAIGLCVGRGANGYIFAVATTAFVFLTLRGLSWVERRMVVKYHFRHAMLRLKRARAAMVKLQEIADRHGARIQNFEIGELNEDGSNNVQLTFRLPPGLDTNKLTAALTALQEVISLEWE